MDLCLLGQKMSGNWDHFVRDYQKLWVKHDEIVQFREGQNPNWFRRELQPCRGIKFSQKSMFWMTNHQDFGGFFFFAKSKPPFETFNVLFLLWSLQLDIYYSSSSPFFPSDFPIHFPHKSCFITTSHIQPQASLRLHSCRPTRAHKRSCHRGEAPARHASTAIELLRWHRNAWWSSAAPIQSIDPFTYPWVADSVLTVLKL